MPHYRNKSIVHNSLRKMLTLTCWCLKLLVDHFPQASLLETCLQLGTGIPGGWWAGGVNIPWWFLLKVIFIYCPELPEFWLVVFTLPHTLYCLFDPWCIVYRQPPPPRIPLHGDANASLASHPVNLFFVPLYLGNLERKIRLGWKVIGTCFLTQCITLTLMYIFNSNSFVSN